MKVKKIMTIEEFKNSVKMGIYKDSTPGLFVLIHSNKIEESESLYQVIPSDANDFQFGDFTNVAWLIKE